MKPKTKVVVLIAAIAAVGLWLGDWVGDSVANYVLLGGGMGAFVSVLAAGVWFRNQRRRRLMDMRDSALW